MPPQAAPRVGQQLEPLIIDSVDPEPMKTVAAILRDPNPIHFNVDAVKSLGLGDRPINQGPLNMAYLLEMACRFAGDPAAVLSFRTRFLGNVFAGERLECTGRVTAVDEVSGTVELELRATAAGRPLLAGTAAVRL